MILKSVLGFAAFNAKATDFFIYTSFSAAQREEGMLTSVRGVAIKAKPAAPQGNMVVFSAASGDETAYPYTEKNRLIGHFGCFLGVFFGIFQIA